MNQDTDEMGHIVQIWHLLLVLGTVLKSDFVCPSGNGSLSIDLFLAGTRTAIRGIRANSRKFSYGIFDGVTEKLTVDGQVAYCIGRASEFAIEC